MNQGFNQVGQAMGQAADQFGQAFNQQGYGGQPQQQYPGGPMMGPQGGMMMGGAGQKSFMTTLLLALFAGWAGVHRFYTGHTMIGVIQLLTCGGMGFWSLLDIIFIVTGKYTDAQGRPLQK
jgi:TM2 domain-containing membrane protein YozV